MKKIVCLFLLLVANVLIRAQDPISRKKHEASRIKGNSPTIDGLLKEPLWQTGTWETDFVQYEPKENALPSQQTRFKVLYDDNFLFIAVQCFDSEPDKIVKRMSRRDGYDGDYIEVALDTDLDYRTAFSFTVSAAGVKSDISLSQNGLKGDRNWNPIWYAKTQIDEKGWTAEMKIPMSQLRFGRGQDQVWGLQVVRKFFRNQERSVWQRIPRDAPGWINIYGELNGLKDLKPGRRLEIQPFLVNQYDTYSGETADPYLTGSQFGMNAGLDAKLGITGDIVLDITVNPDFGQVEADPSVITLDGFQIFFDEQRPFFVENKNVFDYGLSEGNDNVFYSRRIGRSPQIEPQVSQDDSVDRPKKTVILGAAKLSGKTKSGWSLGLLESVTGNMFSTLIKDGTRTEELAEPMTNYLVGRAQKDFNRGNSYLGSIFTATNRKLDNDSIPLRKSAYSAGVDFRHNWSNRRYFIEGKVVASQVNGSRQAITATQTELTHLFQRTDANHVSVDTMSTTLTGTGGKLEVGKAGGGNWRYGANLSWYSPEFELNDIGFLRQADEIRQSTNVSYLWLNPTKWYRNGQLSLNQYATFDFQGNHNRMHYFLNGEINFANNWWAEVELGHKPRIFNNTYLRGGPRWRSSDENFWILFLGSDRRKKFSFTMGHVNSHGIQNSFAFYRYVLRLKYQPWDALSVSFDTEYFDAPGETQYVKEANFNDKPRYIVAHIDQKTFRAALRFNYSINPDLSIQYYGQPYIFRGIYNDFKYVNEPDELDLNRRVRSFANSQIVKNTENSTYVIDENLDGNIDYQFDDPDFSSAQFRSNLVARWEYIPGSEIFLVWSWGVTNTESPQGSLWQNLKRQLLERPSNNTFLIKMTYRFLK